MPNAAPIPRIATKSANGTNPAGGDPFFLSVIAQTTMSSITVPRNYAGGMTAKSSRASETEINGSHVYGKQKIIE